MTIQNQFLLDVLPEDIKSKRAPFLKKMSNMTVGDFIDSTKTLFKVSKGVKEIYQICEKLMLTESEQGYTVDIARKESDKYMSTPLGEIYLDDLLGSDFLPDSYIAVLRENGLKFLVEMLDYSDMQLTSFRRIGEGKVQQLISVKEKIRTTPELFSEYVEVRKKVHRLPDQDVSADTSILSRLGGLISKCCDILKRSGGEKEERLAIILSKYYIENMSDSKIASFIHQTSANIQHLRGNFILDFFSQKLIYNLELSDDFAVELDDVRNQIQQTVLYKDASALAKVLEYSGEWDKIGNLLSLLNVQVFNIDNAYAKQYFVTSDIKTAGGRVLKSNICLLITALKDAIVPLRFEELLCRVNELNETGKDDKDDFNKEIIEVLLESHNWIESKLEGYQLKWKYLPSLDSKAKRIIYEERPNRIHREQILNEYNQRLTKNGLQEITTSQLVVKLGDNVNFQNQDNGYWWYSETGECLMPVQQYIEEYIVSQAGKVSFEEVKAVVSKHYSYPDNTIKTYISNVCRIASNTPNWYIHKDYIGRYPDIQLKPLIQSGIINRIINYAVDYLKQCEQFTSPANRFREVVADRLSVDGYTVGNIYNYIHQLDRFDLFDIDKNVVTLNIEVLQEIDLDKIGKRERTPEYRKVISSLIVSYLQSRAGYKALQNELFVRFRSYIPQGTSDNNFYKILLQPIFSKENQDGLTFVSLNKVLLPEPKVREEAVEEVEYISEANTENNTEEYGEVAKVDINTTETVVGETFDAEYNLSKSVVNPWKNLKVELNRELAFYFRTIPDQLDVALDKFEDVLTEGDEFWGKYMTYSLYNLLCDKTNFMDRQSILFQLMMNYETYLRRLYRRRYGYDLEIGSGLRDMINSLPEFNPLFEAQEGTIERSFGKILNILCNRRNLYAHQSDNEKLNQGFSMQVKTSVDFIALYVYTVVLLLP